MKREELTPIELECNMGKDINGVEHREPWKAYDITEVDQVLDEKDAEIAELKAALEDVKATAYAESVDAGMRERRLRRALWLARAESCRRLDVDRYLRNHRKSWYNENCLTWNDACVAMEVKMCKAENKCLKKAEQYR